MRAATKTLRHSRDWAERERRAPAALSSLFSVTLDVAAHNPLTDGRYLSLVSTVHNVWWVAPGLRSFYKWQGVRIILLHSPCLFVRVSGRSSVYFLSQTIVRLAPLPLWCLTPRPRRRRRQRQSEPEPEWSVRACYQPDRGEHNFRIKAGRGKGCGRQRKSGPGWFYYLRGLWLRLWPLASEGWQQGNTRLISNVFVSAVCCGPAPRVTVRARPPIQGSFFRIFPFV